jgi:2-polyprenyl-3-methyl-5-hydroxy-6-metoxy-1,4-benzoquinol methylase
MGTSRPYYLSNMCSSIIKWQPKSVLDIGVGFGKNGFLCREYTDIWHGRYGKENRRTLIHGVEIFEHYIERHHKEIYDEIFIGNIVEIINSVNKYDIIIATDVIEHLKKEEAVEVLSKIKEKSHHAIVTIPINVGTRGAMKQQGLPINHHEAHISGEWTLEELLLYGKVDKFNNHTWYIEMGN